MLGRYSLVAVRCSPTGLRPCFKVLSRLERSGTRYLLFEFLPACALSVDTTSVKAIAIIPARLASTRLPRKILREIAGRPMLAYVYEAARACSQLQEVIVATDSDEIAAVCRQNNWAYRMTSPQHRSGTDRVHEVAQAVEADVYVNVQGDEPLARP